MAQAQPAPEYDWEYWEKIGIGTYQQLKDHNVAVGFRPKKIEQKERSLGSDILQHYPKDGQARFYAQYRFLVGVEKAVDPEDSRTLEYVAWRFGELVPNIPQTQFPLVEPHHHKFTRSPQPSP
ncbi:MAG: hypothetical protein HYW26_04415 [Candidatus Aenigmarchaeota archaeon]|nr:hypothetical protein [Candidatus Aenigmarchaeota archaeon]